jgi:hypothetical protein
MDHQAAYGVIFGAAQLQQPPPPPPPLVLLPWRAQRGLVLLHGRRKGLKILFHDVSHCSMMLASQEVR